MEKLKNARLVLICFLIAIVLTGSVFFWNYISKKQSEKKDNGQQIIDVSNVNNVSSVDAKLGSDLKITQGYLLTYVIHKGGTWYMSEGYVKNVKEKDNEFIFTLIAENSSNLSITATIDNNKNKIKKGDKVYFVGTIDLKTGNIKLSNINIEPINYSSVTKMEFNELRENINKLSETYFIVSGYMVTDGEKYKLYDTKEAYTKDSSAGNYFLLKWQGEFNYTGNQKVNVKCLLSDTYILSNCILMQ